MISAARKLPKKSYVAIHSHEIKQLSEKSKTPVSLAVTGTGGCWKIFFS